jgi:spore maturation protein CgeB
MRIFYAADKSPNSDFQSDLWRNNLYEPLVDLGHDVVEFDFDLSPTVKHCDPLIPAHKNFIEHNRPLVSQELLHQIKTAHTAKPIDLFFSYFYDACVLPEVIDEIRRMGIVTVNWYCNGSYQLYLVAEIAPHYDWCLVPERFRLNDYRAMGAHPIYCQEAANPNIYRPYDVPVEYDVTFIGQAYGDRTAYIKYLLDQNIDVRLWGQGWQKLSLEQIQKAQRAAHQYRILNAGRRLLTTQGWQSVGRRVGHLFGGDDERPHALRQLPVVLPAEILGGILSDLEMIQMYSRSKINLGFSTCGNTHLTEERIMQIRLRDFEVPMSGGFYMVEYMEELEEFFDIGKEIVCYTDMEDLADKIKYYLRHDSERKTIQRAGYERCRRDHSWHKRFERAFAEMGLS